MKHIEIPTTIVECGFLSNPEEEKLLLEDEYQDRLAWGIYNGIMDYFYAMWSTTHGTTHGDGITHGVAGKIFKVCKICIWKKYML